MINEFLAKVKDINWKLQIINDKYELRNNQEIQYGLREFALQVVKTIENLRNNNFKELVEKEDTGKFYEVKGPNIYLEEIKKFCVLAKDNLIDSNELWDKRKEYIAKIFPSNTFSSLIEKKMYIFLLDYSPLTAAYKVYNYAREIIRREFGNDEKTINDIDDIFNSSFNETVRLKFEDTEKIGFDLEKALIISGYGVTTDVSQSGCKLDLPRTKKKSSIESLRKLWNETENYNQLIYLYLSFGKVDEKLLRQITIECFRLYINKLVMHKETFSKKVDVAQKYVNGKISKEGMFMNIRWGASIGGAISSHTIKMHFATQYIRYDDLIMGSLGALKYLMMAAGIEKKKELKSFLVRTIKENIANPFPGKDEINIDTELLGILFKLNVFATAQYGEMYLELSE